MEASDDRGDLRESFGPSEVFPEPEGLFSLNRSYPKGSSSSPSKPREPQEIRNGNARDPM